MPEECRKEQRSNNIHNYVTVTSTPVIDFKRYGTWLKLKRVTAYVFRAVNLFKSKSRSTGNELNVEELKRAEVFWYMNIQQEAYKDEYALLKAGNSASSQSRLLKLDPYLDQADGIIKVGGRLQSSCLPETVKHPIILPHGNPIVELIIIDIHNSLLHAGPVCTVKY